MALLIISPLALSQEREEKEASKWADKTLRGLSLREKIGQMINFRLNGEFTHFESARFKEMVSLVEGLGIGGFTVYRGNVNSIAALTNELQRRSKVPLLFAADYERGLRMQMPLTGTSFTTAMGFGAAGDKQAAFQKGKIICSEMRAIGVSWFFGPVADLNNNPDNPVINVRSYGEDPKRAGDMVSAVLQGLKAGNCLSAVKHFPGHGDTAFDSHIGLPGIPADRARLDSMELIPFKMAIDNGADGIMTAHLALPQIAGDDIPATLNPKISLGILRKDLGFRGIIVTDAMEMGAIIKNYSSERSVVMAVKAGADVVLLPLDSRNAIDSIEKAVKSGELSEERINESARRILAAKYRLGLANNRSVDLSKVNSLIEKPENVALANRIAERSITLLRNKGDMLPLNAETAQNSFFVILAADSPLDYELPQGTAFFNELIRRNPKVKVARLDPRSSLADYEKAANEASGSGSVVLALFVKRAAGKGTVALPEIQTDFVKKILASGKKAAILAHGSPYLIRQFPEAGVYAVTYGVEDIAQAAAVKTMLGEAKFEGRLPVRIPGLFEIGSGISK